MKTFTFKIPYPPSVNQAWFNRPQKGRVKTTLYKEWEHSAGWLIRSQKPIKFNGPVSIFYTFGKKNRRFDMSNFIKPIEDLLVQLDII